MEWLEVREGQLPKVNQEILYVVDLRGTPEKWHREFINKVLDKMTLEEKGLPISYYRDENYKKHPYEIVNLFPNYPEKWVFVRRGWVDERWPDTFTVRLSKVWSPMLGRDEVDPTYITHWMPMPNPPVLDLTEEQFEERYNQRLAAMKASDEAANWSSDVLYQYQKDNSI